MDKSREEFEAWFKNQHSQTVSLWDVWQASRKAIVINLHGWDNFDTTRQVISAVKDEIEQEGINVKQ